MERGRPVAGSDAHVFVEVRGKRLDYTWQFARNRFHPGLYHFEVLLREKQPPAVSGALTSVQRALRLTGKLKAGADQSLLIPALALCKPLVGACSAIGKAAEEQAALAATAAEGKLDKRKWAAWKRKVEPPLAEAERTLAKNNILLLLPSAPALAPLVARARVAIAACDKAAAGGDRPDAETPRFPGEAEFGAALLRIRYDVLDLLVMSVQDATRHYAMVHDNRKITVRVKPEGQAAVKLQVGSVMKTWPAFQALPWGVPLPGSMEPLVKELVEDMTLLPTAKLSGSTRTKNPKGAGVPIAILLPRLQETVGKLGAALAAEKKKPRS
jgi:hypothetical protein